MSAVSDPAKLAAGCLGTGAGLAAPAAYASILDDGMGGGEEGSLINVCRRGRACTAGCIIMRCVHRTVAGLEH
jgi:hypothetical protein